MNEKQKGQHLVHEWLCIGSHHPEGMDDQLTLTSADETSIPPESDRDHLMKASMPAATARVRSLTTHA